MKQTFRTTLAQIEPNLGDISGNLKKIEKAVKKAREQRSDIVIFPEMCLTGYVLRDRVYEVAERIPGRSVKAVEAMAKKNSLYVVFGMPELSEKAQATIYNASVLVGPEGFVGKYRKMYLPTHSIFEEKRYFRPGSKPCVFETSLGRLGLMICYDIYFPEVTRLARLEGAQLMICISASPAIRQVFFEVLISARAIENTFFMAFTNMVGIEDGLQFWGGSRLVGPNGKVIVQAKCDEEDLLTHEVDYSDMKPMEAFVPTLRDLRPEIFDQLKERAEDF